MPKKPEYQANTSFLIIPFCFGKNGYCTYGSACKAAGWEPVEDTVKYLHRYVSDKLVNHSAGQSQCMHYTLSDAVRLGVGLGHTDMLFISDSNSHNSNEYRHRYRGQPTSYLFRLPSFQLFLFSSGIGIVACQVVFEEEDPYRIASALFQMKQVGRILIAPAEQPEKTSILLDTVKKMMPCGMNAEYFFFSQSQRAAVFTHVEASDVSDIDRKVFYLQNCYIDEFPYTEYDRKKTVEGTLTIGTHHWGVSSEAVVSLTVMEASQVTQIRNEYYPNFVTQYLFLYVFLLHQKYGLYLFLTRIGKEMYTDRKLLEQYRSDLYEFQTDFIYTTVTDVPQYRLLYERITEAFDLKGNYQDVREPLEFLTEIRREEADNEDRRRDRYTNAALFLLSMLSLFSALVDSWDFIGEVPDLLKSSPGVFVFRVFALACILGITTVMVILLIKGNRKRK